ncbi:MAG TPA: metalloregulator ArsR/SmtB family transcription factor [Cytophagaceae bacterium]
MAVSKTLEFEGHQVKLGRIAKALSHPARIAILELLSERKVCICNDLVEALPLSQSTVSQHLKELKEAGLITGKVDGPRVCYSLEEEQLKLSKIYFDRFFSKINKSHSIISSEQFAVVN